jgi:predicted RNA binding protein YcfA (HicA-like mRNA interferase family)
MAKGGVLISMRAKVEDAVEMIERKRWKLVQHIGAVRQYKHKKIPGRITITGDLGDDITPGTLNNVQALLKEKRYIYGLPGNIGKSGK